MSTIYKIASGILAVIIILALVFFSGYYYGSKQVESGQIIFRDKIVTQVVYRDYPGMTRDACIDKLMCYDISVPVLDIKHVDGITYNINAGLCERKWSREVKIEAGRSGNWKFYVGAGIAAGVIGAYLLFR